MRSGRSFDTAECEGSIWYFRLEYAWLALISTAFCVGICEEVV